LTFNSESDVREWLRKEASSCWWVENKRGGTMGFPDAVAVVERRLIFAELKLVKCDSAGQLWVEASPQQVNVLLEMKAADLCSGVIGGLEGGKSAFWAEPEWLVRAGNSGKIGGRKRYDLARFQDFGGWVGVK